ncbi:HAMP domain-containing histidine kinase [Mycobacterium sp. CBMA293]|uniref:sensor histidine kinase n=1 Tax=unclassified Mycolicibacterium TaxID=2636767 RepID=UPI0012DFA825|nr:MULTISPECIES: HAMP domain-containing sensor histidine kinase [unclassified Mycolicibacterium]MUL46035.1 HAMP domain-containing histidine kinase [Mycolicibacterium sp. CBMA 360]MUL60707.1 HAMP domain-containing histidine kinase [Mycolicibacterium sp. CBMA 335]MUL72522.1 HAMP domain-containing histidine kinase [Mycolicibacterium sp. CBMA 311]MUL95077.1 HAMP domain-containing histidine kinase [Mycolicibacterium sp. CBMA 230]MUM07105.1 two-component sensor histidine kinase [Mycolicibacterium sp
MSSAPRADAALAEVPRTRIWQPRTWSLRVRLLVTQVLLLAMVIVGVGAATEFALQRFLLHQLDDQVLEAGRRSAAIFELPPPPMAPPLTGGVPRPPMDPHFRMRFDPESGPGPGFLNAPGQAVGTIGAVVFHGQVDAGVIISSGSRTAVTTTATNQLEQVPPDHKIRTMDLDGLGTYRVIGLHPRHGGPQTIVTGLPTRHVDNTLLWVLGMFCAVAVVALLAAALVGVWIIRRQLAPLSRVTAAARDVSDRELDKGEVQLPSEIVHVDPIAAHTEVGQLGSALNRMLDRIAGALAARHASETRVRQFVADASHELRTPLAAIRGYTELAQRKRDELPADVAHAMNRVESETARMTRLVEDMLLLARLDAGRPLETETVDLTRLVVDAVSDAHIAGPDHDWSLDLPDEPVSIEGDPARLHQVLVNLLANARTHTPAGTSVTTSLSSDSTGTVICIADDGPGIPKALQPEVFQRFARGDSSRSRQAGSTGLGLAIVAAVVKAHGGIITVQSRPGSTVFTVRLPSEPVSATAQPEHSVSSTSA